VSPIPRTRLVRSFGSALVIQATVSASNFLVSWILVRRASDAQYGYYVLVFNALLLLVALQGSFVQAQMIVRMLKLDQRGRAALVGGLLREQRGLLRFAAWALIGVAGVLWVTGLLDSARSLLLVCATLAGSATLIREYLRMVLFAYQRPGDVLPADVCYVAVMLGGVFLATYSSAAAAFATLAVAAAAGVSSVVLSHAILRSGSMAPAATTRGILRSFVPLGSWSVAGAGAHWALSQGYSYMVAGLLSVHAVAAIAATRLLLMPLNLISTGIATQLLPLAADWVYRLGVLPALRRLALVSLGFVALSLFYFGVVWLAREWIFSVLLRKSFAARDELLLLWCGAFALMLVRDQFVKLLAARERFPVLASITIASAAVSLVFSYVATLRLGEAGAVAGIVIGELINVTGVIILSCQEIRRTVRAPAAPA